MTTQTDRELLELAAKAAGIVFTEIDSHGVWFDAPNKELGKCGVTFNPLTDDGDALRLAVKLCMGISVDFDRVDVAAQDDIVATEYLYQLPAPTDPYAAIRRAIVRAAAEIGRGMT